jgi:hypothetical protein
MMCERALTLLVLIRTVETSRLSFRSPFIEEGWHTQVNLLAVRVKNRQLHNFDWWSDPVLRIHSIDSFIHAYGLLFCLRYPYVVLRVPTYNCNYLFTPLFQSTTNTVLEHSKILTCTVPSVIEYSNAL